MTWVFISSSTHMQCPASDFQASLVMTVSLHLMPFCPHAVSFVFGGLHVGSIFGLLAAPALIHALGWESVFVVFGVAGLVWVAWYEALLAGLQQRDPDFVDKLTVGSDASSHGTALRRCVCVCVREGVCVRLCVCVLTWEGAEKVCVRGG